MTVTFAISDLMDGLGDEALALYDPGVADPERVLALALARSGKPAVKNSGIKAKSKGPRRLGRVLLIAAVLAALLSVTAYAVYELVIDRYIIDQAPPYVTEDEAAADTRSRISLVGYQGSPEYKAYTEWETWLGAHPFDWKAAGVDDSWHETPDNYWVFYDAATQEQAAGLDAIMEKYGLTPHTHRSTWRNAEELYDALGTEPFFGGVICTGTLGSYLYEDGSFKTEGDAVFADGRRVTVSGFTNAKGSFADIGGYMDLTDREEWSYETASGVTVDLILSAGGAELMAETDGAYIDLGLGGNRDSLTKEDMEALADSVDFAVLAERFDGKAHRSTAEKVAALEARDEEQDKAINEEVHADPAPAGDGRTDQQILDGLGSFAMDALPEGYALAPGGVSAGHDEARESYWGYWSDGFAYDVGSCWYENTQGTGYLALSWYRFYADEAMTVSANGAVFEQAKDEYISAVYPLIDINGCEGFAIADEFGGRAMWLDRERDVLFELTCAQTPFGADYMADLARTVKPTEPIALPEPTPPLPTPLPEGTWTAPDLGSTLGEYKIGGLPADAFQLARADDHYAEDGFGDVSAYPSDERWATYRRAGTLYDDYVLSWSRAYADYDRTESATAQAFQNVMDRLDFDDVQYTRCQVDGREGAMYAPDGLPTYAQVVWLDRDRDLWFSLEENSEDPVDTVALIALAATVTEGE